MSARSSAVAELRGAALPALAFALVMFAGYASGRSPWHSGGGVGGVSGTVVAALAGVTGAVVVGTLLAVWVVTPGAAKVARRRRRLEAADVDDLPASLGGAAIAAVLVTVTGLVVCAALWPLLVANRAPTSQATEGRPVAPSRTAGSDRLGRPPLQLRSLAPRRSGSHPRGCRAGCSGRAPATREAVDGTCASGPRGAACPGGHGLVERARVDEGSEDGDRAHLRAFRAIPGPGRGGTWERRDTVRAPRPARACPRRERRFRVGVDEAVRDRALQRPRRR